ncbi:hypothetical protein ACLADD_004680 [Escherichia coli]
MSESELEGFIQVNDSATIITHHARNLTPAPFSRHGDNKKQ